MWEKLANIAYCELFADILLFNCELFADILLLIIQYNNISAALEALVICNVKQLKRFVYSKEDDSYSTYSFHRYCMCFDSLRGSCLPKTLIDMMKIGL